MGETAGIGPEIAAKAWRARLDDSVPPFVFIGDGAAISAHDPDLPVREIDSVDHVHTTFADALPVLPVPLAAPVEPGRLDPANAPATIAAIDRAVALARSGQFGGVVTNPIHKQALYEAGFTDPGHTEYLARLCDLPADAAVMMLAIPGLRVVPATVHIPLADVAARLSVDRLVHVASVTASDLTARFGIARPRLAVAGLNPHAGEAGSLGREEIEIIAPAVNAIRARGIDVTGPLPADTLFHARARTGHDAVICMYHDQALIPLKTLDFDHGVNVTLGLPIARTSPDHGTALDIAGRGEANPASLIAALTLAHQLAAADAGG